MFTEINLFHALSVVLKIKFIYFTNKGTMPYIKLKSGKFDQVNFQLHIFPYISLQYLSFALCYITYLHANSDQLISVEVVSFFQCSMISELI